MITALLVICAVLVRECASAGDAATASVGRQRSEGGEQSVGTDVHQGDRMLGALAEAMPR